MDLTQLHPGYFVNDHEAANSNSNGNPLLIIVIIVIILASICYFNRNKNYNSNPPQTSDSIYKQPMDVMIKMPPIKFPTKP